VERASRRFWGLEFGIFLELGGLGFGAFLELCQSAIPPKVYLGRCVRLGPSGSLFFGVGIFARFQTESARVALDGTESKWTDELLLSLEHVAVGYGRQTVLPDINLSLRRQLYRTAWRERLRANPR